MTEPANGPAVGEEASFSRTIAECDVYGFAGLTGDFAPAHMDEVSMRRTAFGRRVAHGAMLVGFMSAASTLVAGRHSVGQRSWVLVSLGYDRVRFTAPVFIGDTITVHYRVIEADAARRRYRAAVTVVNEAGTLVAVATNILAWTKGAG